MLSQLNIAHILLYSTASLVAVYTISLYITRVCGGRPFASAPTWFMLMQSLFLLGTLLALDWGRAPDRMWVLAILTGLLAFVLGAMVANAHYEFRPAEEISRYVERPLVQDLYRASYSVFTIGVGIFCLAVGIVFSRAVGYNVFGDALLGSLRGRTEDPSKYGTLRTTISTDRYVAVGYTIQFTAVLLPLVIYLLYVRMRKTQRAPDRAMLVLLVIADLYFLTITGGRVHLLNFLVTFLLLASSTFGPLPKNERSSWIFKLVMLTGFVLFYGLATTLMGRAGDPRHGINVSGVLQDFYDRIVGLQARGHLQIMRNLQERPIAWGHEWWQGILSIRPAAGKGSGFNADLHALLYNGDRSGSIGLTLWGSLLYNWGLVGVWVFSFFLGGLMQTFTIRYVRGSRSILRVVLFFFAGYCLSGVRDPYSLLLDGFVTLMLFYAVAQRLGKGSRGRMRSTTTISSHGKPELLEELPPPSRIPA